MNYKIDSTVVVAVSGALLSLHASGGDASPAAAAVESRPPTIQSWVDTSYTAAGAAKFRGAKGEDSDAFSLGLGAGGRVGLDGGWSVPLGIQSQNHFLDELASAPVPGRIHTLGFSAGLERRLNEQWSVGLMLSPKIYKFEDLGANDIGLSGGLYASWIYSSTLRFAFGLIVAPDSDVPVLPVAGLDWQINDRFDLSLMYPRPRLSYRIDDRWKLHLGADVNSVTFRTSDTFGNERAMPRYNDALATYRDIRVGFGVGYRVSNSVSLEAETGYSVSRQFRYSRIDEHVSFESAPYCRLGISARF